MTMQLFGASNHAKPVSASRSLQVTVTATVCPATGVGGSNVTDTWGGVFGPIGGCQWKAPQRGSKEFRQGRARVAGPPVVVGGADMPGGLDRVVVDGAIEGEGSTGCGGGDGAVSAPAATGAGPA